MERWKERGKRGERKREEVEVEDHPIKINDLKSMHKEKTTETVNKPFLVIIIL